MLSLTKKTDYALIALGYLADRPTSIIPAREIAGKFSLPVALIMNILKTLHQHGYLRSTRGTKGGYQVSVNVAHHTIYDLITALEGPIQLADCVTLEAGCIAKGCRVNPTCPIQAPIKAMHHKLIGFLKDVKLSDILQTQRAKKEKNPAGELVAN